MGLIYYGIYTLNRIREILRREFLKKEDPQMFGKSSCIVAKQYVMSMMMCMKRGSSPGAIGV